MKTKRVLSWIPILFLVASVLVWVRTESVKVTYEYVQKERKYKRLEEEVQNLKARYLRATSPKRLEGMAHVLGLVPPRLNQIVKYEVRSPDK